VRGSELTRRLETANHASRTGISCSTTSFLPRRSFDVTRKLSRMRLFGDPESGPQAEEGDES
jgi:hypothetical protein